MRYLFAISGILLLAVFLSVDNHPAKFLLLALCLAVFSGFWLPSLVQRSLATVFGIICFLLAGYYFLLRHDIFGLHLSNIHAFIFLFLGTASLVLAFRKR